MTSIISTSTTIISTESLSKAARSPAAAKEQRSSSGEGRDSLALSNESREVRGSGKTQNQLIQRIEVLKTADQGLERISALTSKRRDLAEIATDPALSDGDRARLNKQFTKLGERAERLATSPPVQKAIQVARDSERSERSNAEARKISGTAIGSGKTQRESNEDAAEDPSGRPIVGSIGVDLSTTQGAAKALEKLDTALSTINSYRSSFGAVVSRLGSSLRNLQTFTENLGLGPPPGETLGFAKETQATTKDENLQKPGISVPDGTHGLSVASERLLG